MAAEDSAGVKTKPTNNDVLVATGCSGKTSWNFGRYLRPGSSWSASPQVVEQHYQKLLASHQEVIQHLMDQ